MNPPGSIANSIILQKSAPRKKGLRSFPFMGRCRGPPPVLRFQEIQKKGGQDHGKAIQDPGLQEEFGESKAAEITQAVEDALPGQLSKMQKSRKVSNILQKMKKNGIADTRGKGAGALWFILHN
ncbi:MAG: hypothetical protein NC123_18845 [Butyrivibrio sp.]|nr:hypothetical protein [Butyrivibrio sp.]